MNCSSLLNTLLLLLGFIAIEIEAQYVVDAASGMQTRGVGNHNKTSVTSKPTETPPPFLRTPTSHPTTNVPTNTPTLPPQTTPSPSTMSPTVTPSAEVDALTTFEWTRYLQPFSIRLVLEGKKRLMLEDESNVETVLQISVEYLLEKKFAQYYDDIWKVALLNQQDSSQDLNFIFSGSVLFQAIEDSSIPSHIELQLAQLEILSNLLYELKDLLQENGIFVSSIVISMGGDSLTAQNEEEESRSSDENVIVELTNTDTDEEDDETTLTTIQSKNESSAPPRVYVAIGSTLVLSLGILVAVKHRRKQVASQEEARSNITGGGSTVRRFLVLSA